MKKQCCAKRWGGDGMEGSCEPFVLLLNAKNSAQGSVPSACPCPHTRLAPPPRPPLTDAHLQLPRLRQIGLPGCAASDQWLCPQSMIIVAEQVIVLNATRTATLAALSPAPALPEARRRRG